MALTLSLAEAQESREVPERPGWLVLPSIAFGPVYEDNVLFTPSPADESWLLRLTPRIDAFYRRESRIFEGSYTFDAERYPERFDTLNDAFARQEGYGELRTLLNRRSSIVVGGSFLSTSRPEEVLRDTGLLSLRRRSRSIVGNAQFTRAITRRVSWTAGYAFSLRDFERPEGLAPRLGGTMHSVITGVSFRHSRRTTGAWSYGFRLFVPEELAKTITPIDRFVSHVGTYRWNRTLTRKIELTLSLGPRFSEGLRAPEEVGGIFEKVRDIAPEAFASLTYRGKTNFFTAQYRRTQSQAFGLSGFVDSENGVLTVSLELSRRFRVEANPGIYRNTRAGITTNSFQVDATVEYQFASWASIETGYVFQHQDRLLAVVDGSVQATDDGVTRNTVIFGFKLSKIYALNN